MTEITGKKMYLSTMPYDSHGSCTIEKKWANKSTFTEVSTENNLLTSVGVVKILADRCLCLQIHLRMSDMMF
jgi:hypothetical protein